MISRARASCFEVAKEKEREREREREGKGEKVCVGERGKERESFRIFFLTSRERKFEKDRETE